MNGYPVALAPRELEMLALFAHCKGVTLTKEMFLGEVWGGAETERKMIDATFCKLRRKPSRAAGGESPIFTVWGRGYVLQDPHRIAAARAA